MSEPVNIRQIAPGTKIRLVDGSLAEIVSNPADGVWVFARYLSSPDDPGRAGSEEMIFAQDIAEIRDE
jgi:hypothetical protein